MRSIWKYPLESAAPTVQRVKMKAGARVISAGLDPQGTLCVWAIVDPKEKQEKTREIFVVGTGHETTDGHVGGTFVGTVNLGPAGLPFIFHIFDWGEVS